MSELQRIVQLAELMLHQKNIVDHLSEQLSAAKAELLRTETEDLPELMRELGMSSFALTDGSTIKVVGDVSCAITEERRPAAHAWLIANGFGGLIKTDVSVAFGSDERDAAEDFVVKAAELTNHAPEVVERVHSATLKSFVKERLEAGTPIPFDLFNIHPYERAKIELPKKKKK